jgi:hypothetical protein
MTYKKVDLALFYMVCNSSRVRKRHEFTSTYIHDWLSTEGYSKLYHYHPDIEICVPIYPLGITRGIRASQFILLTCAWTCNAATLHLIKLSPLYQTTRY